MENIFSDTEVAFRHCSDRQLKRAEYLFSFMSSPMLTKLGIKCIDLALSMHLPVRWALRNTIFRQFCGGETLSETAIRAQHLWGYGVGTILDYGVECKENEAAFEAAVPEFIRAIEFAVLRKDTPFISLKVTGFARFALLEKISAGSALTASEKEEWQRVYDRISNICTTAAKNNVMVLIDAEETWILGACNELTEAMMELCNRQHVVVFNTFQMYCSDTLPFLKQAIATARDKGYLLGAKLVRGAYMEKERQRAMGKGYPDPIQPDKAATDNDYDEAVKLCLQNLDHLALFIGTHNEHSNALAIEWMKTHGIQYNDTRVYFSQLLGMSDHISFNLAAIGCNVSKYVPYGPVKDIIPYMIRRARENTSVSGQTSRELSLIRKEIRRRNRK